MDDMDEKIIKMTQNGILLKRSPFADIASELGISEQEIVDRLKKMQEEEVIRRFGASIGHRDIGIVANAMCVWNVPDESTEEIGTIMAGFSEVTHCYERPRVPGWDYNLFAMVHSYTKEDCEKIAAKISEATGIKDYKLLYSDREFKKTGVRL
ncbi:siroheme decarboxylase subunit beta [Methanolobus vulcani]|uniref:siroheme decarboxylase n=1 Tax=Methanolobus vulcani TaxID=38026 RepID=A0A7Z8KPG6_9EURY|nr:siroheme decarboxylase subunit beta [Methanolobus vulcani]TQD26414.1 Lrp/AsnC family transcriptional regulator [Methanolobus vulcani]